RPTTPLVPYTTLFRSVAFRTAAAKVLPEEIAFRKKLGFIVPIRIWMADERYNGDVRRLFESEIAEKFFNVDEIRAISLSNSLRTDRKSTRLNSSHVSI